MSTQKGIYIVLAICQLLTTATNAMPISYCSSQNTGSTFTAVTAQFQSDGACTDTCKASYAFAIVQSNYCWCSNYIPAESVSTSSCNDPCPGFGSDTCGNVDEGLFGYIALTLSPSGTLGTTSSTPAASSTEVPISVSVPNPVTVLETVTASASPLTPLPSFGPPFSGNYPPSTSIVPSTTTTSIVPSTTTTTTSRFATPTTSTTSTTSSTPLVENTLPDPTSTIGAASTWWASPYASIMTVTGQVQTVTVTPTAPPPSLETITQQIPSPSGGFFSDAGKVAGVFVVVALAIMGIFLTAIWCACCRGRDRNVPNDEAAEGDGGMSRRPSKLSQLGFAVKRRSGDWKNLSRNSTLGLNSAGGEEKSPVDTITPVFSRRASGPMRFVDQRLDPNSLWNAEHNDGRDPSIHSFRDDRDYSRRVLRVANPDD